MRTLLICILLVAGIAFGQNIRKIDSLEKLLKTSLSDTARCRITGIIFNECLRIDKKKAIYYNNQMLALSQASGYKKCMAQGYYNKAILMKNTGKNDSVILLLRKSSTLYLQCNDTLHYLNSLTETGVIYLSGQKYQEALEIFLEAEKGYTKLNAKQNMARIYSQIGSLYKYQKQPDEALKYHRKSLKINEEINFKLGVSANLNNIGNLYDEKGNYDSARYFYLRALEIKELLGDKLGIARIMNNIGMVFLNLGDVKKAISYHQKALVYNKETNNKKDLAINYANLGNDYLKSGDYHKAAGYANQSLELALEIHDLSLMSESHKILTDAAEAKGDYKKALESYRLYKEYYDSVINEKNQKAIAEIGTRYDVVKKEKEIAELNINKKEQELRMQTIKANRNLYLSLFIGVVFVVLVLYLRIRNRKKIENHLQEVNEMKSRFFANLSHEFRTPLSLMLGPVEKLLEHSTSEDRVLLEMVQRNAKRALTLDEQLLELTRLETGNQKLNLTRGDISLVLKGIASSFQSLAQRKKIHYTYEIQLNEFPALFDADILEKVTNNLLTNAFKFTPDDGTVSVRSILVDSKDLPVRKPQLRKMNSRYIRIEVQDSGIGIPEKFHEKIFDRFFQVSDESGHTREGTGIGLALTKELVVLHHGFITLTSHENQGSLFSVFLPIDTEGFSQDETSGIKAYQRPHLEPGENKPEDIQENQNGDSLEPGLQRILIVEDNPDMRRYLTNILSESYAVIEAAEGAEGYIKACKNHPDLIITDLMMPGTDGIEFCRKIKSEECTSHIPVIMLTALATTEDKIAGLVTGADDYIGKPFSNSELLARIKNLINQREQLRHLFSTEMKLQPSDVTVTPVDEKFLQKLIKAIEDQIDKPDIDIDFLTRTANMSRSQLHLKLKALTGMPATGFVKIIRLKRAASLMDQNFGNVSDIAYAVGFTNLSYFSKCFREVYGESPSDYVNKRHLC